MKKALILCACLIAGNFIYQAGTVGDYSVVIERSFFQCWAIAWHCVYIRGLP